MNKTDKINNIIQYVRTNRKTFSEAPLNAVDGLVFSWLSYMEFPEELERLSLRDGGVALKDVFRTEYFDKLLHSINFPENSLMLLSMAAASPRFREVRVLFYRMIMEAAEDRQFAAVSFQFAENAVFAAYRGTDMSLIGWKEDFKMSLSSPVYAQLDSVSYIEELAKRTPEETKFYLGGHSKGGNLAVYAAAMCKPSVKMYIKKAFSYDGPGFSEEFLEEPAFIEVREKLYKFLPQSSMIGMIFEQECDYKIVHSDEHGIMQHNPFSWETTNTRFVYEKQLEPDAVLFCKTVNGWLKTMDEEERKRFIDSVFEMLNATGVEYFRELKENRGDHLKVLAEQVKQLDADTKMFFLETLGELASVNMKAMRMQFSHYLKENFEKIEKNVK